MTEHAKKCGHCNGEGKIADSSSGEPWSAWTELTPPADLAVRMGIVKPIDCPSCGGTGVLGPAGSGRPPPAPTAEAKCTGLDCDGRTCPVHRHLCCVHCGLIREGHAMNLAVNGKPRHGFTPPPPTNGETPAEPACPHDVVGDCSKCLRQLREVHR